MIDIEGFRAYLCEEELAPNTVKSYTYAVQLYAEKHDEITKSGLIAYKQEQLAKHKPATVNLRIAAMLAYCRFAKIPMRLKSVKLPLRTNIDNVITPEQLDTLLRGLALDHNRCWIVNIRLLTKTGMRISEAMRVTKRDILSGSVTMHTKDHMRTILFPSALIDEICGDIASLSATDLVFRGCDGYPVTPGGVCGSLRWYAEKYGIPKAVMHPHSFRHFFAIEFLKRRNDIALLADLLGHSSLDMARIYLRQSQQQQREAIDSAVDW